MPAAPVAAKEAPPPKLKVGRGKGRAALAPAPLAQPLDLETRRTRLKNLIALGKERGFLTYAEVNDHLPDDMVDAEQIESIISKIDSQKTSTSPVVTDQSVGEGPRSQDKSNSPGVPDMIYAIPPLQAQPVEQPSPDLVPESWGIPILITVLVVMVASAVLFFVFHSLFLKIVCLIIFGFLLWFVISSKVFSVEITRKK